MPPCKQQLVLTLVRIKSYSEKEITALRHMKYTNLSHETGTLIAINIIAGVFTAFFSMIWSGCCASVCSKCLCLLSPHVIVFHWCACEGQQVLSWNCNVEEPKKPNAKCQKRTKTTHLAADTMVLSPLCMSLAYSEYAGINGNTPIAAVLVNTLFG